MDVDMEWYDDHDVWLTQLAEDEVAKYAGHARDAMLDLADAMEIETASSFHLMTVAEEKP
jgi:hypothetical protein